MAAEQAHWGLLVRMKKTERGELTETDEVKKLIKPETTVGRSEDCDITHEGNILMSSIHCKIHFVTEQKKFFLFDTSRNGTLVNRSKVKNQRIELADGDLIHCAHKKSKPHLDVIYSFKWKKSDDQIFKDEQGQLNLTQEYVSSDEEVEQESLSISSSIKARKRPASNSSLEPDSKRVQKSESNEFLPKLSQDGEGKKTDSCDEIEENLQCGICQDIFHGCVSVQPCMHSFCAACYSTWMKRSTACPTCRKNVRQVGKNHIINNLVAAYLKTHPDRGRSKEELKKMEEKDEIKNETVKLTGTRALDDYWDDEDSEEYFSNDSNGDDDDSDYNGDDSSNVQFGVFNLPNAQFNYVAPAPAPRAPAAFSRPRGALCRQCPNFAYGSAPSNPDQSFTCSMNQNHILCSCCNQLFPDRRRTSSSRDSACCSSRDSCSVSNSSNDQKIHCSACGKLFCHVYWGCRKPGCLGCLDRFEDLDFGPACLTRIVNNNEYESNVLKHYLQARNIDAKQLLRICITKLQAKEFVVPSQPELTVDEVVCFRCGLKFFREMAYQYMAGIPAGDLPREVSRRSDCYWGRNCKTQIHNSSHASRFNHICEQTRF